MGMLIDGQWHASGAIRTQRRSGCAQRSVISQRDYAGMQRLISKGKFRASAISALVPPPAPAYVIANAMHY